MSNYPFAGNLRLDNVRALGETHGIDPERIRSTGDEDLAAIINGDVPCHRWATVTAASDFRYIQTYPTLTAAKEAAIEYVNDGIYAESPVEVVCLDTGRTYVPQWSSLAWKRG